MGARARASAPNHAERPSSKPLPLFRKPGASRAVACPCPMRCGGRVTIGRSRSTVGHFSPSIYVPPACLKYSTVPLRLTLGPRSKTLKKDRTLQLSSSCRCARLLSMMPGLCNCLRRAVWRVAPPTAFIWHRTRTPSASAAIVSSAAHRSRRASSSPRPTSQATWSLCSLGWLAAPSAAARVS